MNGRTHREGEWRAKEQGDLVSKQASIIQTLRALAQLHSLLVRLGKNPRSETSQMLQDWIWPVSPFASLVSNCRVDCRHRIYRIFYIDGDNVPFAIGLAAEYSELCINISPGSAIERGVRIYPSAVSMHYLRRCIERCTEGFNDMQSIQRAI